MGWFSRKVKVTLIDDKSGDTFAVTEMSPTDLPESFERETTLHIGGDDWSVVDASPKTRLEYSKSKTLILRLRHPETIDIRNILYSLPSICDVIPALGKEPLAANDCLLAEDDWRQFELVAQEVAADVDMEIASIRRIHENAWADVGWREIHVRRRPEPPIAGQLSVKDIVRVFGGEVVLGGVGFVGAPSRIESGYSMTATEGLQLYGVAKEGIVTVLGVAQQGSRSSTTSAACLAQLAKEFSLDLVHWCRCVRVAYADPLFAELLTGKVPDKG